MNNLCFIRKKKYSFKTFGMIVLCYIVITLCASYYESAARSLEYQIAGTKPDILNYSAEIVEAAPQDHMQAEEGKKVVKISTDIYNPTNRTISVSEESFYFCYLDDNSYAKSLRYDDDGLILSAWDNEKVLPPDKTTTHVEYYAVPENASHVVLSLYESVNKKSEEIVIQF